MNPASPERTPAGPGRAGGAPVGGALPATPIPAPRLLATGDEAEAMELIARVMRDGGQIADECPLVFPGGRCAPRGRVLAIHEGERVASACATLVTDLTLPAGDLRVGLIGWVVTDPDRRGRGLAGRVLDAACDHFAASGADLALLWADDPEFYRRRGFTEVGAEIDVALDRYGVLRLPEWSAQRALDPGADAAATLALLRGSRVRTRRSLSEHAALLATPRMRARVALDDAGRVVAYACEGRGGDLQGVIHEWAGDPLAVLGLQRDLGLRALATGRPAFALGPDLDDPVCAAWAELGLPNERGVLGMARRLGPQEPDGRLEALLGSLFLWGLDSI